MVVRMLYQFIADRVRDLLPLTISGIVAMGVSYGTLFLFLKVLSFTILIAATAAFVLSCSTNFVLQRFWVYANENGSRLEKQLVLFVIASLAGLLVNDALYWLCNDLAHIGVLYTQIPTTVAVSAVGYIASRRIFRPQAVPQEISAGR